MSLFPDDYLERVYAGVLGKLVGVYMGRPVENWPHETIVARYGVVRGYLSLAEGWRTVVTDDDISGTFTFLRALEDYDFDPQITSAQMGQTWLNYIIENSTILWWGGLFHSSEHTAFLNLKYGIPAPQSGSAALNGPVIANQIGAQIYIDGWAMVAPGDPARAVALARRAAQVSHDDEAVHAACLLAGMESLAFFESDIDRLLEGGLALIPPGTTIARLAQDVRRWCAQDQDWRETFQRISREYGYKKYLGGCHVVPNHALILLGLFYGEGDFNRSLSITCTCGWDVDCNAGNLGCLLGIRGGLAALQGETDWRGPLADRLFLSSADGGRAITDALTESYRAADAGRALQGLAPLRPKDGARFHFSLPGSVQGFQPLAEQTGQAPAGMPGQAPAEAPGQAVQLSNPAGRGLEMRFGPLAAGACARVGTATFILPGDLGMESYHLEASPTLYPGQTVHARVIADRANLQGLEAGLYLRYYNELDEVALLDGPRQALATLAAGEAGELTWSIPALNGAPVFEIGVRMGGVGGAALAAPCTLTLDHLGWSGCPRVDFFRPNRPDERRAELWRRSWVNAFDHWGNQWNHAFRVIQDRGRGMLIQGTREWQDYRVRSTISVAMFRSGGLAARVQGLERFYAFELVHPGEIRLIKHLDGERVLAQAPFDWRIWQPYEMVMEVQGPRLRASLDGQLVFDVVDAERPLLGGGIALTVFEGHMATHAVRVEPLES